MHAKMNVFLQLFCTCLFFALVTCYIEEPGPRFRPTKGEIWPQPRSQVKDDAYFILKPETFQIKVSTNNACTILKDAVLRMNDVITSVLATAQNYKHDIQQKPSKKLWSNDVNFLGYIENLEVVLNGACGDQEYPSLNSLESYAIEINDNTKIVNSTTVWGILRGLESFYQSIYYSDDLLSVRINRTYIEDSPRFAHRGLLLDTSRHYISLKQILLTIEAMAQNKLNVFHWHIVDDQSFPYVSKRFPELSKGAYSPYHVYNPSTIATVIEYARLRGIRVIPEFDTPGHTRSWGVSHPELLTACEGAYAGKYGPLNPIKNETYTFINELFTEIKDVFNDQFIHLGGDEVGFECWESNSNISAFMKANGIDSYNALEEYYVQKLINLVDELNYKSIVWEEVFSNGVKIPNETIVHVWQSILTLQQVTESGYRALLSACWYLDNLNSGGDWEKFYSCEPYSFSHDENLQQLVIGGEACMWGEVVDSNNVISRVWPRASAAAEKLWKNRDDDADMNVVRARLEEHACRMNRRGIDAQPPNGPGFCL